MARKNLFLFVLAQLLFFSLEAQIPSGIVYPGLTCNNPGQCGNTQFVNDVFYDSLNEILYLAGDFNDASGNNRRKVAAVDIRSGTVLPWNPIVNTGKVLSIVRSGNTVYIGGTFTQVNSTTRNYLAAVDATTGLLLPWNPNPNAQVSSLSISGIFLIVGGNFTNISAQAHNYLVLYTTGNNSLNSWQPSLNTSYTNLDQASVYNNKIYFRSDNLSGGNSVFENALNSSLTNSIMSAGTDTIYDLAISNNKIYCTGNFLYINGTYARDFCAGWDLSLGTMLSWNPSPPNNGPCEYHIEMHRDTAFIACRSYASSDTNYHYIKKYTTVGAGAYISTVKYYETNLYNPHGTYFGVMLCAKDKLIEVGRKHVHGPYTRDSISTYCFKPKQPGSFTASTAVVCQGQTNIIYTIPADPTFTTYSWNYSGTGVNINGSGNSITLDFSPGATPGTLSVWGANMCGLLSSPRALNITVNQIPNANAGQDLLLTCTVTQVTLNGSSASSTVAYNWNGPNSFSATYANPPATLPGNYILTVTNTTTGCANTDTALIAIDTVKPAFNLSNSNYLLTCNVTSVLINGSTVNGNDSLRWLDQNSNSFTDPLSASVPGNYILIATDTGNGCSNSDTITVNQNIQTPTILLPPNDTITCINDTIVLNGGSFTANTIFSWSDVNNNLFPDPLYVLQGGAYQLTVTDTTNGCMSSGVVTIQQFTTPPQVNLSPGNYDFNCSSSSITLSGTSQTPNAALSWSGPNNFSSPDPALVTQTGNYILTVTDPFNGCTNSATITVGYQNILLLNSSNDTLICNGSSATLSTDPIGGTAPFNYSWNSGGNASSTSVLPFDSTLYIITVNDANGCVGVDSIRVDVPAAISDSTLSFQPCDSTSLGQVQVYAYGGIPPYSYSIDNGNTFQSSQVFPNLNYGSYNFIIKDSLGCTKNTSASITTSSQMPDAEFLVSTGMMTQDTFVLVDISNPRPDSIQWIFPASCTVVNNDPFAPEIINSDTGTFSVTMNAYFGTCMIARTKNINVTPFDTNAAGPYNNNGIASVDIFPDPNNGQFSVNVQLYKKQSFVILVYDANGTERFRQPVSNSDNYTGNVSVQQPVPGTYVLKVIAEYDSKGAGFIIQ